MNVVVLVGRLTRDPELRYTPNGTATCTFTLAVDDPFAKGDKKADFINVVVWRQAAEASANYLRKGRLCAVEGRWSTRNYENNEGKRVYVNECVASNVRFLESANSGERTPEDTVRNFNINGGRKSYDYDPFQDDGKPIDISDSDLPF